ncbi:solute carrier family 53 member 1-like [Convolutriloba macropyga]|uniref:solute carrier family 53 member 1-like n=1 Tax=Convolutriloba macropyga TaxID=536237 RepID=UPI003F528021
MKFAAHLSAHITPEWRKQYVRYEYLKEMLYYAQEQAPPPDISDEETIRRYYTKFDQKFFIQCEQELNKINMFFSEKLAEAHRKWANLHAELQLAKSRRTEDTISTLKNRANGRKDSIFPATFIVTDKRQKVLAQHARKISDLKLAFSEFYLSLILLQNYQSLNFTGFRKILKKHDKILDKDSGTSFRVNKVESAPFYTNKQIDKLIHECEETYISELEEGNRTRAMKRLRVPPLVDQESPRTTFFMGFFSGSVAFMSLAIILIAVFVQDHHHHSWSPYITIYRGMFLVIYLVGLLGVNTFGWRKYGVNHVLIFELDPRDHISFHELLEVAFFLGTVWCSSVIFFLFSPIIGVNLFISPLICFAFFVFYLFNPIHSFKYKARFWLIRYLFRIVTAPLFPVSFPDFWLADQLNSLQTMILDIEFLLCYYIFELDWFDTEQTSQQDVKICGSYTYGVRIVVAMLPAWFRFAQCLRRYCNTKKVHPHLVNAGKYSTTFITVSLSAAVSIYKEMNNGELCTPLLCCWGIACFISSCYTLSWDLKMDWGLLTFDNSENPLLREETVYPSKAFYYFAIIENTLLRFAWTFSFACSIGGFIDCNILTCILAVLEVFRRFIWNYFRLENEHLNNCGEFRATRDISIAPLEEDHQALLCEMMDNPEMIIRKRTPNYGGVIQYTNTNEVNTHSNPRGTGSTAGDILSSMLNATNNTGGGGTANSINADLDDEDDD